MNSLSKTLWAIVVAGGSGTRFGAVKPKQFLDLMGRPVLEYCLELFEKLSWVEGVVLVLPQPFVAQWQERLQDYSKTIKIVKGGKLRQDSTQAGLDQVPVQADWVLVHDAARPMVTEDIARDAFDQALKTGAAVAAVPVADTLKKGDADQKVRHTVDREKLYAVQTPQVFARKKLEASLAWAKEQKLEVTDEASLFEKKGEPVALSQGSVENFKITRLEDLEKARAILAWKKGKEMQNSIRLGEGYDVHRLVKDRDLILGGVKIPCSLGLLGHSDADALLHATCDALLGALALGDLGHFFPDTDPKFKDVSSSELLTQVYFHVKDKGFRLINLDATIICQKPKLAPHLLAMRKNLAKILEAQLDQVSVKATTEEGMGFTGEGEGIAVRAVVLLKQSN